jgi:hypothetical protein
MLCVEGSNDEEEISYRASVARPIGETHHTVLKLIRPGVLNVKRLLKLQRLKDDKTVKTSEADYMGRAEWPTFILLTSFVNDRTRVNSLEAM